MKVFKIQRPIFPAHGLWLIYDERREYQGEVEPNETMREIMGDKLKVYVDGRIDAAGMLHIYGAVTDRLW